MRLSFLISLIFVFSCHAKKIDVTFVLPEHDGHDFWNVVGDVGQSAASSLNTNLEMVRSENNRFSLQKEIYKISQRKNKPDYVIFRPFQGNALQVFTFLEKSKIKFITLEQVFLDDEADLIGLPQQKFKYWLSQVNYDNKQGGELLTKTLLKAHQQISPHKTAYITGLTGSFDAIATDRHSALINIPSNNNDVKVQQLFSMNWDARIVKDRFKGVIKRYPKTNIFWCAGDDMALEVVAQIQLSPPLRTNNITVGGFDWMPAALKKIEVGEITASVGGHFLMAAQALVTIYEHHNGLTPLPGKSKLHHYEVIDKTNIAVYIDFIENNLWWGLDYKQFSLHDNENAPTLSVNNLITQYNQK